MSPQFLSTATPSKCATNWEELLGEIQMASDSRPKDGSTCDGTFASTVTLSLVPAQPDSQRHA
jgi:hypothetical protein